MNHLVFYQQEKKQSLNVHRSKVQEDLVLLDSAEPEQRVLPGEPPASSPLLTQEKASEDSRRTFYNNIHWCGSR